MFFGRDDLRQKMRGKYSEVFDHAGSGEADTSVADDAVAFGNAELYSLLSKKGFDDSSIRTLAEAKDPVIVAAGCWIAADYGALMKPHTCNPETGKSPYDKVAEKARKAADEVASMRRRLMGEQATGTPERARARTIEPAPEPKFYMAPTASNPRGGGGF